MDFTEDKDVLISGLIKESALAITLIKFSSDISSTVASIVIGRYFGSNAIAAFSFDKPVISWLFSAFASVLSVGISIACATTIGKGDKKKASQYFTMSILVALIFSAVGIVVFMTFLDPIVSFLGAKDVEVAAISKAYLTGWLIGLPAYLIQILLQAFIRLEGGNKRNVAAIVGMTVTTVIFDFIAVWMNWGMFGIALATSLGNYVSFAILGVHFLKKDAMLRFHLEPGLPWGELLTITQYGMSSMIAKIARLIRYYLMNQMLLKFGGLMAVTAYMIRDNWIDIEGHFESGISTTARLLSGVFYGEHDERTLKKMMHMCYRYMLIIYAVIAAITFFGAPYIVSMFLKTNEEATIKMCVQGLKIFAIALPFYSVCCLQMKYLEGIQKTVVSNAFLLVIEFVYPLSCAWIFGELFGITGVWASWPISNMLSIVSYWIYIKIKKTDYFFLKNNADIKDVKSGEYTVTSLEEACEASKYAEAFCKENGIDQKRTYALALCVEEVASNCVTYGARDGKKHHVDVRFMLEENGKIILRIRDDCKFFDPEAYYGKHHLEDPASGIGIKMIFRMSKDVKYVPLLGRNTVLVTI